MAEYFLQQAKDLDDNITAAEKKIINEMTKVLVKKADGKSS